ncbi:MAG: hypothetical protein IPK13_18800 [Deltaproteobacteria bacterium]|nr:hypothetical protein [Deltaproteobacteria bacterium]
MIVDLQVSVDGQEGAPADPAQLMKAAKGAGLDGIVLTKDGTLSFDAAPYIEAGQHEGLAVFTGAKISTNHGLLLCILPEAAGVPSDDFAAREDGIYEVSSVIDAVDRLGGVTVALRPYDRVVERPMGDHIFSFQGLAACDVQNASVPRQDNDLALEAASSMEIPCIGASSSRGAALLGQSATLIRHRVESHAQLCEAIRNGDCWPVTFSDEVPASDARAGGDRGGRGGRRHEGAGRRDHGPRGPRSEGDRGPRRAEGSAGGGRRGGGRRGGGRRGGDGRGAPRGDGYGNRGGDPRNRRVEEDAGNRVQVKSERVVDDNIGNRLAPGESSPYRPTSAPIDDDHGAE